MRVRPPLLFAVGALVACSGDDDNGTGPGNSGWVRVVHLDVSQT